MPAPVEGSDQEVSPVASGERVKITYEPKMQRKDAEQRAATSLLWQGKRVAGKGVEKGKQCTLWSSSSDSRTIPRSCSSDTQYAQEISIPGAASLLSYNS